MKNLKPKIEKALIETIEKSGDGFYKAYAEENKIMVKITDELFKDDAPEEWFHVPEYEHEEAFCFTCDGGMGWEKMNPCDAEFPDYEFEEKLDEVFKSEGLFFEPYASWKHIVTEVK
tara:strand:+ start:1109 stop:1459 length:351 start_codon:yes stop_codon:yes gene_type:complete